MRRIGNRALFLWVLLVGASAFATEFSQSIDRNEVGTEDTFQLTITLSDAPSGSELKLPSSADFETLSKSQSTQVSLNLGAGTRMSRIQRYVLVMRPNRTGNLTVPAAELRTGSDVLKTESIPITVKSGRVAGPNAGSRRPQSPWDPFGNSPFDDDFGPGFGAPPSQAAQGEADVFLKATLSSEDVYVGEQVTYALYVYSRVDLSSVDAVVLPKLEGFWGEELETPTQLVSEQKVVNGVPYRAYLLRRRALFPMKAGEISVEPARADITTGFLFAGRQVTRQSSPLTLKVKPLPPGGPRIPPSSVGTWNLSIDANPKEVDLGQPVTVRVSLEGTGNLKQVQPPPLKVPTGFRRYDPTLNDQPARGQKVYGGRRTQEYLLMPQQAGTFELPALEFPYFDPAANDYKTSRTEPISISVKPGSGGGNVPSSGDDASSNVLAAGGLLPLRASANLTAPPAPVRNHPLFWLALTAPPLGFALVAWRTAAVRRRLDEGKLKLIHRDGGRLLDGARRLINADAQSFYLEVERAIFIHLERVTHSNVQGLTRSALGGRLQTSGMDPEKAGTLLDALDRCDLGRFAGSEISDRASLLSVVESAFGSEKLP